MSAMAQRLHAEVMRPSTLGAGDVAAWRQILAQTPSLQRAFLTPTFARGCERANGRAYVAVIYEAGIIRGFLPFQFRSLWHQRLRLAERIGGEMSDAAGLVAAPEMRIDAPALLRLAGLASLAMTHLMPGQERFGLEALWSEDSYITDVRNGPDAYFAALLQRERAFLRDTERQLRRATSAYGALRFTNTEHVTPEMTAALIRQKRQQYQRTRAEDTFAPSANLQLIDALNEMADPECRLVMSRLEAGGRVLAQHLGPQYHDTLSYWFPVYDPEVGNMSPGRLLLWHTLQRAKEIGVGLIDYGAGDAVYKRKFANAVIRSGRAHWFSGDPRSTLARAYQGVEWRIKASRQKFRMLGLRVRER
jgi:CelD/BcsL family acetyltransferase involved in cellulose biosynthesis